jgi:hypothetical protein
MRRLTLFLIVIVMTTMIPSPTGAETSWRLDECRFRGLDHRMGWSTTEVQLTIRCAAPKFGVSTETALQVAARESGYRAGAVNVTSGACGVFQFYPASTIGVRLRAVPDHLGPFEGSCLNARDNVLAAMKLAQGGWGPWGIG